MNAGKAREADRADPADDADGAHGADVAGRAHRADDTDGAHRADDTDGAHRADDADGAHRADDAGRAASPGRAAALPAVPAFPALPGFGAFSRRLADLGFRHAVDPMLRAPQSGPLPAPPVAGPVAGPSFRVLDGLWLSGPGGNWLRVDTAFVNDCRKRWEAGADPRADAVRSLLSWLRRRTAGDPMHLRRVVLYQLSCLLTDAPGGPTAEAAERLGVHPAESSALAAMVAAGFPAAGPIREAAEEITDVIGAGRLHRAAGLAAVLPGQDTDPVLAGTLAELRRRTASVQTLIATAAQRQRSGSLVSAAAAWLGAARLSVDDPQARAGLLGVAALRADATAGDGVPLHARLDEGEVALDWQPVRSSVRRRGRVAYTVFRFPEGAPEQAVEVSAAGDAVTARDTDVPTGTRLRYVVLALHGDRAVDVPCAAPALLSVPEVTRLSWKSVPEGVALNWRAHPRAAAVRSRRGTEPPVAGGQAGLTDRPLPAGEHWYCVSSGYRSPSGDLVWSPGRTVSARAEQWPTPVPEVSVGRVYADGRVEITWTDPARGTARLVPWRSWRTEPGEDVSVLVGRLGTADVLVDEGAPGTGGADGPGSRRRVVLRPTQGEVNRMMVVSVLDGRAVAGPSVLIDVPRAVTGLTVERTGPTAARVSFRWPEPAVLALLRWEQGGRVRERRVAHSRVGRDGVEIPLDGRAATVTVSAVPRPDATVVVGGSARQSVPALPAPVPRPAGAPAMPTDPADEDTPAPGGGTVWWQRWWRAPRRLRRWARSRRRAGRA